MTDSYMINLRVLGAMVLGALICALGALFLGEYEFDEMLPIGAGVLLAVIMSEIVISVGGHRSRAMALVLATWAAAAVLLAGHLDTNGIEAIKPGAYLSAGLAAFVAGLRGNNWRADYRARSSTTSQSPSSTTARRRSSVS